MAKDEYVYRITLSDGRVKVGNKVRLAAVRRQYPGDGPTRIVMIERTLTEWKVQEG